MFFGKYHIVIFKEKSGVSRNVRFRGWLGLCSCLVIAGLVGGNVWLWDQYENHAGIAAQLREAKRTIEEQNTHLSGMVSRISELQDDLGRVQKFDAKLRLMMNMDRDIETTAVGGSRSEDFSRTYLPLHRQELMVRKMNNFLKQLSGEIQLEEVRQQDLLQTLRSNREALASIPTVWPIEGFLTSRFGSRPSPFSGRTEHHKGLDIAARMGTPIYAPCKGTVVFSGVENGYGNTVVMQHGAGLTTRYAHMQRSAVKEGDVLRQGEIIGYVGNTGRSSGPHLHYEVKLNGVNVNPMRYILN